MSVAETTTRTGATFEADRLRAAMRNHPAGVVVITADVEGRPVGLTATSFTSVSLDPPLVSFYIAESSTTWPDLRRAPVFGVHLLAADQAGTAARFAAKGVDRFTAPTSWRPGPAGVPLLEGATTHLVCEWYETRAIGDHVLVVGRVTHAGVVSETAPPLVHHRGTFGSVTPSA